MIHLAADAGTTVACCHLMIQTSKQEESAVLCRRFVKRRGFP